MADIEQVRRALAGVQVRRFRMTLEVAEPGPREPEQDSLTARVRRRLRALRA